MASRNSSGVAKFTWHTDQEVAAVLPCTEEHPPLALNSEETSLLLRGANVSLPTPRLPRCAQLPSNSLSQSRMHPTGSFSSSHIHFARRHCSPTKRQCIGDSRTGKVPRRRFVCVRPVGSVSAQIKRLVLGLHGGPGQSGISNRVRIPPYMSTNGFARRWSFPNKASCHALAHFLPPLAPTCAGLR